MTDDAPSGAQELPATVEDMRPINPATSAVIRSLDAIKVLLREVLATGERREVPAPTLIDLSAGRVTTHVRLRVETVIASSDVAVSVQLMTGTAARIVFRLDGGNVVSIPLPVTIERGVEISISDLAGVTPPADLVGAYLVAYPE